MSKITKNRKRKENENGKAIEQELHISSERNELVLLVKCMQGIVKYFSNSWLLHSSFSKTRKNVQEVKRNFCELLKYVNSSGSEWVQLTRTWLLKHDIHQMARNLKALSGEKEICKEKRAHFKKVYAEFYRKARNLIKKEKQDQVK